VWIQFHTNATNGQYAADTWVALIAPKANAYYPDQFDYTASNALYMYSATTTSPAGGPIQDPYGPTAPPPTNVAALRTPEGYLVYANWNGGTSSYDIYIQISPTHSAKYVKSSSAPSDYSTSNRSLQPFTGLNQETYDGRVAVSNDTDFDGISNGIESNAGLNATNNDTDGDGLLDGLEWGGGVDTDHDGLLDAKDKDSDNDGIPDGTEDANHNGFFDAGETDRHQQDSDGDSIKDGYETGVTAAPSTDTTDCFIGGGSCPDKWAFTAATSNSPRTSPLDRDSDDDGIGDKVEEDGSWCYVDLDHATCTYSADSTHVTDPTKLDTDGDGLSDGLEIGLMSAGVGTDLAKFKSDQGPGTHTDPTKADTDGDGLTDGQEDANLDGRTQNNETYGWMWDSDSDGLCDGNCSNKGEDLNKNGIRDQDADGNWTETDPLANDSDVDGILDGQEVNGSWCYSGQVGCTPGVGSDSSRVLQPLNADTDEDGLGDGQEIAGWKVALWREITMESIKNYTVNSDPRYADTDNDNNSDLVEFQNGSDPRLSDTDGDLIDDWTEVNRSMNVTGFYMQPPQITDWDVHKESRGGGILGVGDRVVAVVKFDARSYWGLDKYTVFYGQPKLNDSATQEILLLLPRYLNGEQAAKNRYNELLATSEIKGADPITKSFGGVKDGSVAVEFTMSSNEDYFQGAWIRAEVSDIFGLSTQKTIKLKSALEAIIDFLAAVAKAIAEAASAFVKFLYDGISYLVSVAMSPIRSAMESFQRSVAGPVDGVLRAAGFNASRLLATETPAQKEFVERMMWVLTGLQMIVLALTAVGIIAELIGKFATGGTIEFVLQFVLALIVAIAISMILTAVLDEIMPGVDVLVDAWAASAPGGTADLENHVAARDLLVSAMGLIWDIVMKVLEKMAKKAVPKTRGFTLSLFGFFLAAFGYEFQRTQQGQISLFAGMISLGGLALSALGFFYFKKEEANDLKKVSKLMYYVKLGIALGSLIGSAGAVVATAPAAFNCLLHPTTPC
jgi:hypothetical protein